MAVEWKPGHGWIPPMQVREEPEADPLAPARGIVNGLLLMAGMVAVITAIWFLTIVLPAWVRQ